MTLSLHGRRGRRREVVVEFINFIRHNFGLFRARLARLKLSNLIGEIRCN